MRQPTRYRTTIDSLPGGRFIRVWECWPDGRIRRGLEPIRKIPVPDTLDLEQVDILTDAFNLINHVPPIPY